jgi:hypothetical protein
MDLKPVTSALSFSANPETRDRKSVFSGGDGRLRPCAYDPGARLPRRSRPAPIWSPKTNDRNKVAEELHSAPFGPGIAGAVS